MASIETIRRIRVQQISEGGEAVRRDLLATAEAQKQLGDASNSIAVVTDLASKRQLSAATAYQRVAASLDPAVKATTAYERALNTLDRAIGQGVIGIGEYDQRLTQLQQKFGSITSATAAFAAAQKQAAQAAVNKQTIVPDRGGDIEAYGNSLDALRAKFSPLFAVERQFLSLEEEINQAARVGAISEGERMSALDRARATMLNQTNEIRKADEANGRLTKSTGLNAYAWQNLGFQINDVVTSLASGISPFQTLAQQGGQITQVLQSDQGGLVGGLNSVKNKILELLSPARLVFGGITAAVAGAAYATYSYSEGQRKLTQNLDGAGRGSGATVSGINRLAPDAAAAGKISTVSAREMAGEFAATGKIGTEMYAGLIASARDYATTTGQELPEASKALAEAFADPSKGADALNKQLGFLNDTQRESIQRLQAQGNTLGAQKALFDGYVASLSKADERLGFFTKQWEAFKNTTSGEVDAIGRVIDRVITGGDLQTRLETAQKVLSNSQARQSILPFGIGAGDTAKAQAEVTRLQGEVQKERQRSDLAQQNRVSLRIGDIVRGLDPAREAIKKIEDQAKDIADNFAKIKFDEQGASRNAMAGLLTQAKQLREDLQAGGSAFADSVRAAQFGNRTVGFTPQGQSAAQIEENAANKGRDVLRAGGNQDDINARLQSIELERTTMLRTLEKTTQLQQAQIGGAYSRMSPSVQAQINSVSQNERYGNVRPELIAAIAEIESRGKLNVGYTTQKNPDGSVGTAYGLGQITKGTAADAVRRGFLPPDFDRMNESTMVEGIAGVLKMKLKDAGGDEAKALNNYGTGPGYSAQVYRKAGQMGDPSTQAQVKDEDSYTRALRDQNQALDNAKKNYGQNGLALEANAEATRRYNALLDAGVPASDALAASIKGLAAQTATAAQQVKLTQFARDTGFDREQLGRTSGEQSAYARARSIVGDTATPQAQGIIEQAQLNDNLRQTKDLANSAFSGMLNDLRTGTSLASTLNNFTGTIASKLINVASDRVISQLFGGLLGGTAGTGGGVLSGLAGLIGGGAIPKFAGGGIMNGPSIAGEAGPEAAVPLPDGRRIPVMLSQPANANTSGPANIQVFNNAPVQVETRDVDDGRGGRRQEIIINEAVAGGIRSPQGQGALREKRLATG